MAHNCICMYPIVDRDITTLSWPEAEAAVADGTAHRRAYPKLATPPAQQEGRGHNKESAERFTAENAKRKDVAKMSVKPIKLFKIAKYIRKKVKSRKNNEEKPK